MVLSNQFEKNGSNDILIGTLNQIMDYKTIINIINKHLESDDNETISGIKEDLTHLIF